MKMDIQLLIAVNEHLNEHRTLAIYIREIIIPK